MCYFLRPGVACGAHFVVVLAYVLRGLGVKETMEPIGGIDQRGRRGGLEKINPSRFTSVCFILLLEH
jgi:hypothetical protein